MLKDLEPVAWMANSLKTKIKIGFNRDSEVLDGSSVTLALIDDLAILGGPLKDKIYALYASGVEGYEGQVFSPKQIISMLIHKNPYRPGDMCRWTGGIRTDTGIIYGPRYPQKQYLFESLCDELDLWNPKIFKDTSLRYASELRDKLDIERAGSFSDSELATYLVANYAQYIYLIIHPFWNRNGRTSEELLILFSSSNSARRHVFHENSVRYNVSSSTRMELINGMAAEIVTDILQKIGVDNFVTETQGYNNLILKEGTSVQKNVVNMIGPYLYRFAENVVGKDALNKYFNALETELSKMINDIRPDGFVNLINNKSAIRLLNHYMKYGHKPS